MKIAFLLSAAALSALPAGQELSTRYQAEKALRVSVETTVTMEVTDMQMLRDGEPIEGRGGGFGGGGSTETRRSVHVDRYLACPDGRAARVRRTFEEVEGGAEMGGGEQSRSITFESPFPDLVVEVARDEDGDLAHEVIDGSDPGQEKLELLRPELSLDALLPSGEVEEGDSWDLEQAALINALGLDLAEAMFERPEPQGGGGREGRGGGRGGRGGFRGGGSTMAQLHGAEWAGKATFERVEDRDGESCAVIAIEIEAERDLGDGESMSGSFQAEVEGTLYVALEARRPLALELEGSLSSETDTERERQGSVMEFHRESEGGFKLLVRVEETAFEEE